MSVKAWARTAAVGLFVVAPLGVAAAQAASPFLVVASPVCSGWPSIAPYVGSHQRIVAAALPRDAVVVPADGEASMTVARLREALAPLASRDAFVFYTGHGAVVDGKSQLCLGAAPSESSRIDRLLGELPPSAEHGAVFVADACESGFVDLTRAQRPVSVLSASRDPIGVDTGFPDAVAAAIQDPRLDWNCDGLTTDDELFDAIVRAMPPAPVVEHPMVPELTRSQRAPVRLPFPSRCEQAPEHQRDLARLLDRHALDTEAGGPKLATDLRRQLVLAGGGSGLLPEGRHDYFCLRTIGDAPSAGARVERMVLDAGVVALPRSVCASTRDEDLIARFAIASDVYDAEVSPDWLVIHRRRGPALMLVELLASADLSARVAAAVLQRPGIVHRP